MPVKIRFPANRASHSQQQPAAAGSSQQPTVAVAAKATAAAASTAAAAALPPEGSRKWINDCKDLQHARQKCNYNAQSSQKN